MNSISRIIATKRRLLDSIGAPFMNSLSKYVIMKNTSINIAVIILSTKIPEKIVKNINTLYKTFLFLNFISRSFVY